MKKQRVLIWILLIALVLGGVSLAAFFDKIDFHTLTRETIDSKDEEVRQRVEVPEGKKLYTHPAFRFSVIIPEDMEIDTYREPGQAARTLTFSLPEPNGQQFQVYIVPYREEKITSSQVLKDTHGRAIGEPEDVSINEALQALTFITEDPVLGTLREVWFIKNGYLYEVTGPSVFDAWLLEIMQTWEFID